MNNVKDLDQIREICNKKRGMADLFIQLNYGARSSKQVYLREDNSWSIFHAIDGEKYNYKTDYYFEKEEKFFFEALKKGAVYEY